MRHGETDWSRSGRHTGTTDIPLTPEGKNQARALVPWLAGVAFSAVFTSPRLRARRTCELAGLGGAAQVEQDLEEWRYGDYEGFRTVEIQTARPGWDIFRDGCPEGESPGDVSARADRLIAHLCTLSGNVALFSHGQFGCALAARWIGSPVLDGQHFSEGPASLGILASDAHHPEIRVIALWNAAPVLSI